MNILAIETSCDETAIAFCAIRGGIHAPKISILSEVVASQIDVHREFGGVVPNLAKREHTVNLPIALEKVMKKIPREKNGKPEKLDVIAVTVGPGLEPALWTGIEFAKKLGKLWNVPVIGANHLEGHLYSFLLAQSAARPRKGQKSKLFPAIGLIVSGGHTILVSMDSMISRKVIGETLDDAAGEAFDKVARMLNLPYPGGVEIEKLAKTGNHTAILFPRPLIHTKDYNFSFSGLKTAVLYYTKNNPSAKIADIAASFQAAAIDVLIHKTIRAAQASGAKNIFLSGGVAANSALRKSLSGAARKNNMRFFVAPAKYNTDNAVMIALAGFFSRMRKKKYALTARGTLNI